MVLANEANCIAFKDSYNKYEYLWKNDLQTALAEFVEKEGQDGEDPELAVFDKEIAKYKAGRCRLTVSNPVLKAPMVSALACM